ncbi:VIT1/CCC1 transporter family protein [Saccharopolyspora dendranthemae]|uniref:VIT1/CCC1 family predicted Fe2+/Mn2+ transporter n=1 Tax=Saccharopolyspora dendranthemae TaxID=1181886 RepID=A0A561U8X6_9PSEU|nr:VIT1/CCC1 family protein [Saccharopolyspora dendranthemae]TWF95820.1 VIT1/CCC1 family predicted Fe2+/Mn2+ transporter [Saccharopolyspora dendranthemae]
MHDKIADGRSIRRWRRRLADEREEARVYRSLADRRTGEERDILLGLAEAEERHARYWEDLLGDEIGPRRRGHFRMRLLVALARRFGSVFVLALAQRAESRSPYHYDQDVPPSMAADERIHEEVVRALAARGRARVSGSFRAAVFGANDGLVSNLALVLGVIGGNLPTSVVLLTGLSGLLAGALSMGAGEYISVRSQRELLAAATPDPEARAVVPHLDVDANELALVYRARGMDEDEAQHRADALLRRFQLNPPPAKADPEVESGSPRETEDPGEHEVVGSGLNAAVSSFVFFASGALVPVLPFLVGLSGLPAVVLAVVLVGLALMLTGATVGVLSGAAPLPRALRQLAIGLGAAGVTYLLGVLFGATAG